jgi:hypothetical protein
MVAASTLTRGALTSTRRMDDGFRKEGGKQSNGAAGAQSIEDVALRAYVRAFQRMLNDATDEALRDLTTDEAFKHALTVLPNSQASGRAQSVDRH